MTTTKETEKILDRYFKYIKELRHGEKEAVVRLVELWDDEGVFEFLGAPPVTGTFKGITAINVLYQNRLNACGMEMKLEGSDEKTEVKWAYKRNQSVELGFVDTTINRTKIRELKAL